MAYLILSTDGHEWDRRELTGPVVLGRSPDCDVSIHDILLSRRHCRITPCEDGWLVIDLASRNGTVVGDQTIEQQKLAHGDVIRIGKITATFRTDAFVPRLQNSIRPKTPPAIAAEESLAGTVFGMEVVPSSKTSTHRASPRPRPLDPASFETDNLYAMLEQIASSSWDSIYEVNARAIKTDRFVSQPMIAGRPRVRPARPQVSLALQLSTSDRLSLPAKMSARRRPTFRRISQWISRIGHLRLI